MCTLKLDAHLNAEQLKEHMQKAESIDVFRRWQCLYLVLTHAVDARFLSELSGLSKSSIYQLIERYNKQGPSSVQYKERGGRHHAYLSEAEETMLLENLGQKAAQGQILTVFDIQEEVEKELGFSVSDDYLWGLFKRHQWKKKAPRPQHPKRDARAQQNFKKKSKTPSKRRPPGLGTKKRTSL
jgi:transposase